MVLVKNQSGSPDIRSFSATIKDVVKEYIRTQNDIKKAEGKGKEEFLPYPHINIAGIKSAQSVRTALADVEKIDKLIFKFFPLNDEWDYDSVFGGIEAQIRRRIQSNKGRMEFPSPQSVDGVADIIEETEGMVKTELKVQYKEDSDKAIGKQKGTIKDNELSEVLQVEVTGELSDAYEQINGYGHELNPLHIQSENNLINYEEFVKKRKK